ncbi:12732_t:CDS:2 [Ambispora gerdemannii]|uniref:12732_t:CDS:1 n=1 Tax=Ambispora gerdemannii TaxID=144530 RepID=A0A9N9CL25_9GLOM|nr:12732_t:CDS:2 [Ambispora gerdemannii]
MEMIYSVIPENIIFYVIIAVVFIYLRKYVSPTPISTTLDVDIRELKRDMLALKNDHARIENDLEWRSEVRSRGQASITNLRSEYSTEIETLWVEFTVLFDERRKREKYSPCLFAKKKGYTCQLLPTPEITAT